MRRRPPHHSGFTLIELSIVLVIIGLIAGGILVGQTLIHQAQVNKVITDLQKYMRAAQTFRTKYDALPGDFANATQVWGTASDCNTFGTATTGQAATCNGNGNGVVGPGMNYGASYCPNTVAGGGALTNDGLCVNREQFTFWQQLANAGMIEGQYSGAVAGGTQYGGGNGPNPGVNVPDSGYNVASFSGCCLFSDLAWMVLSEGTMQGSLGGTRYANAPYTNALALAAIGTPPSYFYWQGITPGDMYNIDLKIDDGLANSGHLQAVQTGGACYNTSTGAYILSATTGVCSLTYNNAF